MALEAFQNGGLDVRHGHAVLVLASTPLGTGKRSRPRVEAFFVGCLTRLATVHSSSVGPLCRGTLKASLGESKYRGGLEELKSFSYSKLYKEEILTSTIPSGFVSPKLGLRC